MGRRPLPPPLPSTGAVPEGHTLHSGVLSKPLLNMGGTRHGHTGPLLLLSSNRTRRGQHHPKTHLK